MYEQIFSIAAICLIAAAGACWSAVRKRSLKRQRLHEKYGKIPETGDWDKEEQVKNYYEWMKKKESGDWVDDITWSDLSMNLIFQRINVCDTSAGEEILYWRLRKNSVAPGEGQELEQRIRTFSDNEQEREESGKALLPIIYLPIWRRWKSIKSVFSGCSGDCRYYWPRVRSLRWF